MTPLLIISSLIIVLTAVGFYSAYQQNKLMNRIKRLRPPNTMFSEYASVAVTHPSQPKSGWMRGLMFISNKHVIVYPHKGSDTPIFSCLPHEIEGFWRPKKYTEGMNDIEIHTNADGQWAILKVRLWKSQMERLVRKLKTLVSEDVTRSYRQKRPYVYRPPAPAYLAMQDLYGMWEHKTPIKVYLTPNTLVFLSGADDVIRVIMLRDIQNLRVVADEGGSLVCFSLGDEEIAIATDQYEVWAQSIATAAKRTLEDPIERKRKAYADADDEEFDSEFDMDVWESQEYVLGDDGELQLKR